MDRTLTVPCREAGTGVETEVGVAAGVGAGEKAGGAASPTKSHISKVTYSQSHIFTNSWIHRLTKSHSTKVMNLPQNNQDFQS